MGTSINLDKVMEIANAKVADIKVWKVSYWTMSGAYCQCDVYVGADNADDAVNAANVHIGQVKHDAVLQVPFWSRAYGVIMVSEFED